jgi:4-aminobutyrate aminotransferase-like enzyme/Ser/Thr protein kinase RdoA (MazF antagonist)
MNYNSLIISIRQVEEILFEHYRIKGVVTKLPGEIDFNFRVKINNCDGYVFKISRPKENENYLDFQQKLLKHVEESNFNFKISKIVHDIHGNSISEFTDDFGNQRKVRLLTWVSGRIWNDVNPQLNDLRFSLGAYCGQLTDSLKGFEHKESHRKLDWDIAQSIWTKSYLHLFEEKEKEIISFFQKRVESSLVSYKNLRKSIVHNDANENNIIVTRDLVSPKVKAIIDYGDAVFTQIINDVAVVCAYAIMHYKEPLDAALPVVKGYHSKFPLQDCELIHLYNAIAMRLVISVTKSAINKIEEPDNVYLQVSEKPAWEVLKKWRNISPDFAYYSFREACGFFAHPNESKFLNWAAKNYFSLNQLFPSIKKNSILLLDLSVSSNWIGHFNDFNDLEYFEYKINKLQSKNPSKIIAGGYLEYRPLYTSTEFDKIGNSGRESRTLHLGIDFWLPQKTPVYALFDGEVVVSYNNAGNKLYGGLIILKHQAEDFSFYTLYGHLSIDSVLTKKIGDQITKGTCIGYLGRKEENGNWVPHLHFQVLLSLLNYKIDFPGVAFNHEKAIWKSICPNPNLLFKLDELKHVEPISNNGIITYRQQHVGKSLSLHYKQPIKMVRGAGQYLMDQYGKKYLDTVNNVAHVGHEKYSVVKAGQEQMALINTNSRYLHENMNMLAKELIETLPSELNVLHFVNSGSEANELAIRMVKAATGQVDMIASEVGYHGNTNMCIDISSYKFDGKGGKGAPKHTHIFPLPDAFRGKYRGEKTGEKYANEVKQLIAKIQKKGRNVGGFIIEPIISCGGQIELPEGFLSTSFDLVRKSGGICISDEVQTGCGRMGKTFWGFQLHNVIPDIVTIGKPLGNGHPVAAVACTQEIAEKFAKGMEYFNTFGGNPISCAIGTEVLRTVKQENLQKNALVVGEFLKSELIKISKEFPIVGDVRGQGLFLGIELVDADFNPLPLQTDYLVNRMKDVGILMSIDGNDHNVIKIKPPLVFTKENAEELIFYLRTIFVEDFMKLY